MLILNVISWVHLFGVIRVFPPGRNERAFPVGARWFSYILLESHLWPRRLCFIWMVDGSRLQVRVNSDNWKYIIRKHYSIHKVMLIYWTFAILLTTFSLLCFIYLSLKIQIVSNLTHSLYLIKPKLLIWVPYMQISPTWVKLHELSWLFTSIT